MCTGLGVPPRSIKRTIGVVKAYTTRVGIGPFPTELTDAIGQTIQKVLAANRFIFCLNFIQNGHEFGTTTGRPRRCGWLDIPLLQYSHCLNGYDELNITKLDVLTGIPELCIAVKYQIDGQDLHDGVMPRYLIFWNCLSSLTREISTPEELANVKVKYEVLPGWTKDISSCRDRASLPEEAKAYLDRIEVLLGIPIVYIGVGPGRDDMIVS